jgi:hypothetical protein
MQGFESPQSQRLSKIQQKIKGYIKLSVFAIIRRLFLNMSTANKSN